MQKFVNEMDGGNEISDAEMRLITVNGQTIMLEGNFENINMTNEFLNEMLMVGESKVNLNDNCNIEVNENSCINCAKETNDESPKLEISIQGDNNELETVQIGVEEAKALGLYFYGSSHDEAEPWNCTVNEAQRGNVVVNELKANGNSGNEIYQIPSVPIMDVECPINGSERLLSINSAVNFNEASESQSETFSFGIPLKVDKLNKQFSEDNIDSLPAIGHLEDFQIPTSEDGVLLPATVNAKMIDGSYQTITLVPQVVNGAVTYTVHFSNLSKEVIDKNSLNLKKTETVFDDVNSVKDKVNNVENNSVEQFISSVQSIKNNQLKKVLQNNIPKISDTKAPNSGFINTLSSEGVLNINKDSQIGTTSNEVSVNYLHQNQIPIDAKIDNLISENENVISRCKKVKYGKKMRSADTEPSLSATIKVTKNSVTKAKKVKFKNKNIKLISDEIKQKNLKLSLLKSTNEHSSESCKKGLESTRTVNNMIPHMNLNGRLEYPNLKALDETASSLSYLKVKGQCTTRQPYFNVLPYPKEKVIPVQKQILPLNCDLQQAKSLINLQKFLETQKLQLQIQPIVSNGNKIINIKPKPTTNDEVKLNPKQLIGKQKSKLSPTELIVDKTICKTSEGKTAKKSYQETINVKDILLSEKKSNSVKFLKSQNSDGNEEDPMETSSDHNTKLNGIFIKNNPEYFSQKVKDGKMDEHPLGSSENPIQLVQTGHTFHSRQPLSETQLRQIASILQKQKLDSPNIKKNSIFDPKTNTRIVYRVVYPEDVELRDTDKSSTEGITKKKRGRHKTKFSLEEDEEEVQKKISILPRGPGRPKKSSVSAVEEEVSDEEIEDSTPKKKIPRTRSGRLSRPPRYMVKDYKQLPTSDTSEKISTLNFETEEMYSANQKGKDALQEKTDNSSHLRLDNNLLPGLRPRERSKRNVKPEYRCPTCQKIYLGHTRMMWHLNKFPDHCNVEKYKENYFRKRTETKVRRAARRLSMCDIASKVKQALNSMPADELKSLCGPLLADALTTWDFLLLRVNLMKNERKDEVDALLHELILLLEKLRKIAEDIFLPVFSKESEKEEDCVEIDRMEVAIALGLPVGLYKINNDNLNLLRLPSKNTNQKDIEKEDIPKDNNINVNSKEISPKRQDEDSPKLFPDKESTWENEKSEKKLDENSFWLENKEDGDSWQQPEGVVKPLSTKFEPNLSSKLLDSSNDSIDDGKYEEPVQLLDLDSNLKDIERSNSSGNLERSPDAVKDHEKISNISHQCRKEEKSSLWNENSTDKISPDLWNENSSREKWDGNSDIVGAKASSQLWVNGNPDLTTSNEKPAPHLWNENSNLTSSEKVDETNSEFLDSFLSVQNSSEFLANEGESFLSDNIALINEKSEDMKPSETVTEPKEKREWRNDSDHTNYMRVWETEKNRSWSKEESILTSGLQERMPGARTTSRLTSTPESNGSISFSIPNRRNSISDFSNINLESANLDMVLPSAKTLIKDCLKNEEEKFEIKKDSFLETSNNYKVKNWVGDITPKSEFSTGNVNSEDLMKIALESLTEQHDVINVQATSFDSTMGILNQTQETGNLNLFSASETDGLDFNLQLPEHLLRTNFAPSNFQTTCAPNFTNAESPAFLSTTNNIFSTTCTLSNSIKFDQFEPNFTNKKGKSLDDVMEFFDSKASFNGYEGGNETNGINNFSFESDSSNANGYPVTNSLESSSSSIEHSKKKKSRTKQKLVQKRVQKVIKKTKNKKTVDEYPKTNTIESIINEALFDSCGSNAKPLQLQNSSPNCNSSMGNTNENYSLPIISGSLDEVENLDFLNQD